MFEWRLRGCCLGAAGWLLVALAWLAAGELQPANQASQQQREQGELGASQPASSAPAAAQQKLPKINIYISKNEIRKLLGIDTRINYVTNGNINTYPLGFTIPLGYNQSDLIFTWQNLGQSNVNYSISLVIGNMQAVEPPLINITRSGLIPRQEQVFKITLPCSGRLTDEVDVQVLINISGWLAEEEPPSPEAAASVAPEQAAGPPAETERPAAGASAAERGRQVSHTLAIKRKKICTMHPVQVPVRPRAQQAQPQPQPQPPTQPVRPLEPANRWTPPTGNGDQQQQQQQQATRELRGPSSMGRRPAEEQQQQQQQQVEQPATSSLAALDAATAAAAANAATDPLEQSTRKLELLNLIPAQPRPALAGPQPARRLQAEGAYAGWPQLGVRAPAAAIPPDNPLNDIIAHRQQQQHSGSTASLAPGESGRQLLLSLVALSLLVSVALLAALALGSSNRSPLAKLNSSLAGRLLGRAASSRPNKCSSTGLASAVIGSLRAGPKAAREPPSKGAPLAKPPAYCYETNCAGFYAAAAAAAAAANADQCQQHHLYQQLPTADLLGTGYQCHSATQQQHYPIYHIATGSQSHTTRLIWNKGKGISPDGFTIDGGAYMPLSNAPRSDSGSVYQTIY